MRLTKSIVLVFHGEIYNSSQLRIQLESEGVVFTSSHSDTEVVYRGYMHFGIHFITRLSGMFAIAIWDESADSIYLARDSLGIKPLYYRKSSKRIYFGSEIKILGSYLDRPRVNISTTNLSDYFLNRVCSGRNTLFMDCYRVLPGEVLEYLLVI